MDGPRKSMMERALSGEHLDYSEVFDDEVDAWNESTSNLPLHEWLGLTWMEYGSWLSRKATFAQIVEARKQG